MANLHASLDSNAKVEFHKFPPDVRSGGSIPQLLILNSEMKFTLVSFMGFPAILSALQPFQICIFNRKNSQLTFSNAPQLMRKRFMANLHASLDSTCKSRISQISTRYRIWGGGSIPQLLILNSEMNLKIFTILGGGLSIDPHTPY